MSELNTCKPTEGKRIVDDGMIGQLPHGKECRRKGEVEQTSRSKKRGLAEGSGRVGVF